MSVLPPAGPMECVDLMADCAQLVEAGECKMNMAHMDIYCKKSCNFCGEREYSVAWRRVNTRSV